MMTEWSLKKWEIGIVAGVFAGAAVMAVLTVVVATNPDSAGNTNRLSAGLLQGMTLILGIGASFVFGRLSARAAAREILRPHARSAFRRSMGLYQAFSRLNNSIAQQREELPRRAGETDGRLDPSVVDYALQALSASILEQIGTANDALDDWRDLIPNEVDEVERQILNRDRAGSREVVHTELVSDEETEGSSHD